MMTEQPFIQLNNLHHNYLRDTPLEVPALRGATMEIYKGESVGIIGRTGAGWSPARSSWMGRI